MINRIAYWCLHKDHDVPVRVFFDVEPETTPKCQQGHRMMRQGSAAAKKAAPKKKAPGG